VNRFAWAGFVALFTVCTTAWAQVARNDFTVRLEDFETKGQITYPKIGTAPFPTVLLIHGSTPMDMNATITANGKLHSSIFEQIADHLSSKGFAVVRYNKRHVTAPGQADLERFYKLRLQDFRRDAKTVLEYAKTQSIVDAKRLFVYGWSEGSPIAASLALEDTSLRGVIVQGPVAYSYARTFQQQFPRVGLPYLTRFATNGRLDLQGVRAALDGNGGLLARSFALYLLDPTAPPAEPRLNPYMDRDKDGTIDLEREAKVVFEFVYQDSPQTLGMYSSALALPGLIELAPKLNTPMLILQGENDANTSVNGARDLELALRQHPDQTLKVYAGLGHSLGKASDVTNDDFRPMEPQPLIDLEAWLTTHAK
jgi:hypothetical protein